MREGTAATAIVLGVMLALSVVAHADSSARGLPAYTEGYRAWVKLNRRPVVTPGAHTGVKNVFASRPRGADRRFPNGTVIVKAIAQPGVAGDPGQVAVMRKLNGTWQWVEYRLAGSRYAVLAKGQLCASCHAQAKARDWVFTR